MIRRKAVVFTDEELAEIDRMDRAGLSVHEIARALGRPYSSVLYRLRRMHPGAIIDESQASLEKEKSTAPAEQAEVGGVCRCLGGCGKLFRSPDRKRIRFCPTCRKRIQSDRPYTTECCLHI